MRITFALPAYIRVPVGGHKMVYEYANRLRARGHQVAVVHARNLNPRRTLAGRLDTALWKLRNHVLDRPLVPWFPVDPRVRIVFVPDLSSTHLPDADILVATSWQTARWVADASASRGRKFYLIQHYETWSGEREEVDETWSFPLHKIVISSWLHDLAVRFGEKDRTTLIQPGLDFSQFGIMEAPHERSMRVGMLHHPSDWKGSRDGVAALEMVRELHPNLSATLFGIMPRPEGLPKWIDYRQEPSPEEHVALYNSCAIFLQPSWSEGWGLPATEAMMCGCAVVTTDNGGSRDYAIDNETALVAPPRDPRALADRVLELVVNADLRLRIALAGNALVQRFTWARAIGTFEELVEAQHVEPMSFSDPAERIQPKS